MLHRLPARPYHLNTWSSDHQRFVEAPGHFPAFCMYKCYGASDTTYWRFGKSFTKDSLEFQWIVCITWIIKKIIQLGRVAQACNPSTLGGGGSLEIRSSRQAWSTWWNPISTKNTKISCMWWQAPAIQATQEAEAGEWLRPRKQKLQWAEIMPLHFNSELQSKTLCQK